MTMFAGAFELPRLERVAVDTGPTVAASAGMPEVRDRLADRCVPRRWRRRHDSD